MSDRPTPETESHFPSSRHKDDSWVVSCEIGLIRDFERERDEARKEAAMWKANHDNQVKLKAALMDRPDLGDRARKVVSLAKERDEARELSRELRDALESVLPYIEGDRIAPWKPCVSALTKAKEVLG